MTQYIDLAATSHAPATPGASRRNTIDLPVVDDIHGRISRTWVRGTARPRTGDELHGAIAECVADGRSITVAGGRHAMGRQAFGEDALLLDTRGMNHVLGFDRAAQTIEVEAGIDWPTLVREIRARDRGGEPPLSIIQKQTGADRMTIGGSVSANAHGRGLALPPIGSQVESMRVVTPSGRLVYCSRDEESELFGHVIGGYGLFGAIASVNLRLEERFRVRRRVELRGTDGLMGAFEERRRAGCRFGDFQFAVDDRSDDFLHRGVFSCYEPTTEALTPQGRALGADDWRELLYLAHVDKARAFELYAGHYLHTDGQVYESDTHQLASYQEGYHASIDARTGATCHGSEVITELYVERASFEPFMETLRERLRRTNADVIYGTVRLIERGEDAFLAWAREPWVCVILNLHVDHDVPGFEAARRQFRSAIDAALEHGGSFYLTYHDWATAEQLRAGHPAIDAFLEAKATNDPSGVFASEWLHNLRRCLA